MSGEVHLAEIRGLNTDERGEQVSTCQDLDQLENTFDFGVRRDIAHADSRQGSLPHDQKEADSVQCRANRLTFNITNNVLPDTTSRASNFPHERR